jgi:predicted nucleotidyltransferase
MKGMTPEHREQIITDDLVLMGYRGSVAHNMYIPNIDPNSIDDIDLMGVYMAPVDHYIGIKQIKETREVFIDQWDVVCYEFTKFVRLLLKCNPNVMSLLWLKDNQYIKIHPWGKLLIENRDMFVSKKAYHSFTGYAYNQLKRMTHCAHEGYMGQKRKALVEKYGYDCKNAAHCIRLLKMGIEFITEGHLNVAREDASYLLEIKRGRRTLEYVQDEAARLFKLADEAYVRSKLPYEPEYLEVNEMVKSILFDYIGAHKDEIGKLT